jgi:hypothetical protein
MTSEIIRNYGLAQDQSSDTWSEDEDSYEPVIASQSFIPVANISPQENHLPPPNSLPSTSSPNLIDLWQVDSQNRSEPSPRQIDSHTDRIGSVQPGFTDKNLRPVLAPVSITPNTISHLGVSAQGTSTCSSSTVDRRSSYFASESTVTEPSLSQSPFELLESGSPEISAHQIRREETLFDDGIFLRGSAYQELHATLRNHIFDVLQQGNGTGTPETTNSSSSISRGIDQSIDSSTRQQAETNTQSRPHLTQQQEYELWKNYTDEVAPWVRFSS